MLGDSNKGGICDELPWKDLEDRGSKIKNK